MPDPSPFLRRLAACSALAATLFMPAHAAPPIHASQAGGSDYYPDYSAEIKLVEALKKGGFVLVLRHGPTIPQLGPQPREPVPTDPADCTGQRMLSPAGQQVSAEAGSAIKGLGFPVGAVLASPYCRTMHTAWYMFGAAVPEARLMAFRSSDTEQLKTALDELVQGFSQEGRNLVLVTHYPLAAKVFHVRQDEGDALVLKPYKGRLIPVGLVPSVRWADVLRQAARPASGH
ncbi:MAG: hypothetical protein AB1430_17495 [Pseudomonadota bacterium]